MYVCPTNSMKPTGWAEKMAPWHQKLLTASSLFKSLHNLSLATAKLKEIAKYKNF